MDNLTNFILVFCEGPHDTAFLYRILKTVGYKNYSRKIKDFPRYIAKFLIENIQKSNIEELKLDEVHKGFLPGDVLFNGPNLLLLYSIGGDSKKEAPIR